MVFTKRVDYFITLKTLWVFRFSQKEQISKKWKDPWNTSNMRRFHFGVLGMNNFFIATRNGCKQTQVFESSFEWKNVYANRVIKLILKNVQILSDEVENCMITRLFITARRNII